MVSASILFPGMTQFKLSPVSWHRLKVLELKVQAGRWQVPNSLGYSEILIYKRKPYTNQESTKNASLSAGTGRVQTHTSSKEDGHVKLCMPLPHASACIPGKGNLNF